MLKAEMESQNALWRRTRLVRWLATLVGVFGLAMPAWGYDPLAVERETLHQRVQELRDALQGVAAERDDINPIAQWGNFWPNWNNWNNWRNWNNWFNR